MSEKKKKTIAPGVCVPWEEKAKEIGEIPGDIEIVKRKWEDIDSLGHTYIWHCLLSF